MQDSSHLTIILCSSVIKILISQKQKVNRKNNYYKMLLHSLGLVYKSMSNSIDRNQWLNALGRNRTRDPRVPEPKRTPLGYILPKNVKSPRLCNNIF
jgi:hypothetical protein